MKVLGTRWEWWIDEVSGRTMLLLHVRQRHGRWYRPCFLRNLDFWWMTDGENVMVRKYNMKLRKVAFGISTPVSKK